MFEFFKEFDEEIYNENSNEVEFNMWKYSESLCLSKYKKTQNVSMSKNWKFMYPNVSILAKFRQN